MLLYFVCLLLKQSSQETSGWIQAFLSATVTSDSVNTILAGERNSASYWQTELPNDSGLCCKANKKYLLLGEISSDIHRTVKKLNSFKSFFCPLPGVIFVAVGKYRCFILRKMLITNSKLYLADFLKEIKMNVYFVWFL